MNVLFVIFNIKMFKATVALTKYISLISGSVPSVYLCSLFQHHAAPKVERLDDTSCEVTWEALPPMKGDPVIYTLQCMMGNSEFKQVLMLFCERLVSVLHLLSATDLPFITVALVVSLCSVCSVLYGLKLLLCRGH